MSAPVYEWSRMDRPLCEVCGELLYVTRFADAFGNEIVGGGFDLLGALMELHQLGNHNPFTADDLVRHGIAVP